MVQPATAKADAGFPALEKCPPTTHRQKSHRTIRDTDLEFRVQFLVFKRKQRLTLDISVDDIQCTLIKRVRAAIIRPDHRLHSQFLRRDVLFLPGSGRQSTCILSTLESTPLFLLHLNRNGELLLPQLLGSSDLLNFLSKSNNFNVF